MKAALANNNDNNNTNKNNNNNNQPQWQKLKNEVPTTTENLSSENGNNFIFTFITKKAFPWPSENEICLPYHLIGSPKSSAFSPK